MRIIGLTGGVGAGKSTVVALMKKHYDVFYLHCDVIAHEVMEPGKPAYDDLIEHFGEEIKNADGQIDRSRLYEAGFSSGRVEELNACIHKRVHEVVLSSLETLRTKEYAGLVLIEAALLIEAGYRSLCDEFWYVYAPEEVRKRRLMKNRGYTLQKVESIMSKQASDEVFRKNCDFILYNDDVSSDGEGGHEDYLLEQIQKHLGEEATHWTLRNARRT